jgi:hypothetical protein
MLMQNICKENYERELITQGRGKSTVKREPFFSHISNEGISALRRRTSDGISFIFKMEARQNLFGQGNLKQTHKKEQRETQSKQSKITGKKGFLKDLSRYFIENSTSLREVITKFCKNII